MGDEPDEDDLVQVSHMVPEHHRDAASDNTEFGGVSEAVREVYRILANNGSLSEVRLELQLRKVRNDRQRLEEQIEDLQAELDHLADREAELEDRVSDASTRGERYEEMMDDLDEILQRGERVFPEHGKVQRAAELGGCAPEEVLDELRERNPDVDDSAFGERESTEEDLSEYL